VFVALAARISDLGRLNRTRIEWNAIANGQFILVTRASYEAAGTHEAVKSFVADDLMLAQTYVRSGFDIFLVHAVTDMTTRMYGSLREILEGWTKNLALAAPFLVPSDPVAASRTSLLVVDAGAHLDRAARALGSSGLAVCRYRDDRGQLLTWIGIYAGERAPVRYAFLYPLGSAMVAFIMIRSAWRGGRKVEWRGRVYRS